ncbi:phosphogluconate dehydrogenase C-terminal domain-containing protein [Marinivivus vitaminiproducens]|uniref:phosphogluconate dehydrogenase C-terminal domain-containing protein n=1 Tax=Marinivivus vitaminiproducens TaxID=3035935 RepID=UPI0027A61FF8|nr:phosphogluconate dehydrogenase C-terminal domain-containing protein [Geminicoccaceae bacterium SCSIO 64248]
MTKIALLGAGGKMGVRLASNLVGSPWEVHHVEINEIGRKRLKDIVGADCVDEDKALADADVVLMATPDALIGTIAKGFVHKLKPGAAVIMLDAAAPHAGELPERSDITYFVTHPCHPPVFNDETDMDAKNDFFGGIKAKQHIVCALMQGPEEHYTLCEQIARTIYKPVMRSHRVTVEQLAILEPALSETVGATLVSALHEATEEAIRRGVPRQAAVDFMLGHINIELAIMFGALPGGQFSDGALLAIKKAKPKLLQDSWLSVFEPDEVKQSVVDICHPKKPAAA